MNLACSYLRPIEGRLRDVIIEVASSKKIRLNIELGKQMMKESPFFDFDPETLDDTTDEEFEDEKEDILSFLTKGAGQEE